MRSIGVDSAGYVYLAGHVLSSNFPATGGGVISPSVAGQHDILLLKVNPGVNGSGTLLYAGAVGGTKVDVATWLALDESTSPPQAYVAGFTNSNDFPTTSGAPQVAPRSSGRTDNDGFVLKHNFTSSGSGGISYATYLGGSGTDESYGVVLASSAGQDRDIFVSGNTASSNYITTTGAYQPSYQGNQDGFITRLKGSGGSANLAVNYSTYFGGSQSDDLRSIALITPTLTLYGAGHTYSQNFPATAAVLQTGLAGGRDAYVARFNFNQLVFTSQPATTTLTNVPFSPTVKVAVRNLDGTTNTGYTGVVTLSLSSGASSALTGTLTRQAVAGVADFTDLTLTISGTNYILRAAAPLLDAVDSVPFTVTSGSTGTAGQLSSYTGTPQSTVVSTPFTLPLQVQVRDIYNNPVAGAVVTFSTPITGSPIVTGSDGIGRFASAVFSTSSSTQALVVTATSGVSGIATTPQLIANRLYGSYTVTATAAGVVTPTLFSLANLDVPSVPLALTATPGDSQVALVWQAPVFTGGAVISGYNIYRLDATNTAVKLNSSLLTALAYSDTGLANDTEYFYLVTALNRVGESAYSFMERATPQSGLVLSLPPVLLFALGKDSRIELVWQPATLITGGLPVSATTAYEIYRQTGSSPASLLTTITVGSPADYLTYTDTTAANGTTYTYTVVAVSASGKSKPSNPLDALANPEPVVPTEPALIGASASTSAVSLTWNPATAPAYAPVQGYRVYRLDEHNVAQAVVTLTGSATSYQHATVLTPGLAYFYLVTAYNQYGESYYSRLGQVELAPQLGGGGPVPPTPSSIITVAGKVAQPGLVTDTLTPRRIAIVRGQVFDRNNQPLQGVSVTVLSRPSYGYTTTDSAGWYTLVVNGGELLTLSYQKANYLPSQRQTTPDWQSYEVVRDVVLIGEDPISTTISLNSGASQMSVAQGSVISDARGVRQATLLFSPTLSVALRLPDGTSLPYTATSFTVRATEYTVGATGLAAMPGDLPATSSFTYAAEFGLDEAKAAGAVSVEFSEPVASYTTNFLGFPPGTKIPVAYYDRQKGQWIPQADGIVVKIVGTDSGKVILSTSISGTALTGSEMAELGIGEAELKSLYSLAYPTNTSLWRVATTHFTPMDYNLLGVPPVGGPSPDEVALLSDEDLCKACEEKLKLLGAVRPADGKLVEAEKLAGIGLGLPKATEETSLSLYSDDLPPRMPTYSTSQPLSGTDFSLAYRQDWLPGYRPNSKVTISVTNKAIYDRLLNVEISVQVAGRKFTQVFAPSTAVSYTFSWDGQDAFGNALQGDQKTKIEVSNVYQGLYLLPPPEIFGSFGINSGEPITGLITSGPAVALSKNFEIKLGTWDTRSMGLGGWTVDEVHFYEPHNRVLYEGSGVRRETSYASNVVQSAGSGTYPQMVAGSDGSFYLADGSAVHHWWPLSNTKQMIAGHLRNAASITPTVGVAALGVNFGTDVRLAVTPDNTALYILATSGCNGLWKLVLSEGNVYPVLDSNCGATEEIIEGQRLGGRQRLPYMSLFSTTDPDFPGSNNPAISGTITHAGAVAASPDGSIYIADNGSHHIWRVGPDGVLNIVAGNGISYTTGVYTGDNGAALAAPLPERITRLTISSDGSLYFVGGYYVGGGTHPSHIRRILPSGIITTVAGIASIEGDTEGFPIEANAAVTQAVDARFMFISEIIAGENESLYVADFELGHIYLINQTNGFRRVVGDLYNKNGSGNPANGTPALAAQIFPFSLGVDPQGIIYLGDAAAPGGVAIRQITPILPGFTDEDLVIKSRDGSKLYRFNKYGQHLETKDTISNTIYTIHYYPDGRLAAIKNVSGTILLGSTLNQAGDVVTLTGPGGTAAEIKLNPEQYDTDLGGLILSAAATFQPALAPGELLGSITRTKRELPQRQGYSSSDEEVSDDPDAFPNQPITSTMLGGCGGGNVRATHFYDFAPDFSQLTCQRLNTSTRNYVAGAVDLALAPPAGVTALDLSFARYYNSLDTLIATTNEELPPLRQLGKSAWRHSFQWEMEFGSVVTLTLPGGRHDVFTDTGGTTYESPRLTDNVLTKAGSDYELTTLEKLVYRFNDKGVLQHITDRNGNRVKLSYSTKHLTAAYLCLATSPDCSIGEANQKLLLEYQDDYLLKVTDHLSRTVSYSYTDQLLTTVTDPEGRVTSLTHTGDEAKLLKTVIAPGGQLITRLHYDLDGRFNSAEDANGKRTAAYYESLVVTSPLKITIVINQLNNGKFSYCWDNLYRTIGFKDATGGISTYIYDEKGRLTQLNDPNKHKTTYSYYGNGLAKDVTDHLSHTTTLQYNSANQVTTITDPRLTTTSYEFDNGPASPPTAYVDSEGLKTLLEHQNGRLTKVTSPNGLVVTYQYDSFGYPTTKVETFQTATNLTNPQAGLSQVSYTTSYSYDRTGKLLFASDKNRSTTGLTYTYDKSDRLLKVTNQLGQEATYSYNPVGTLAATTNFLGQTTSYQYDAVNHLTRSTQQVLPRDIVNVYSYKGDQLFDHTDPNGVHTSYSYDLMGRLVRSALPLQAGNSRILAYEYDLVGNLLKQTALNSPQNQVTEYEYDEVDRLKAVKDANGYYTRNTYDANANLTKVERDIGSGRKLTVNYVYDPSDRLTSETLVNFNPDTNATSNLVTSYSYNSATNFASVTDPYDRRTSSYRDALGRVYSTTLAPVTGDPKAVPQGTYAVYNQFDQPVRVIDGEGYWQDFEYETLNRPVRVTTYTGKAGSGTALVSQTSYEDKIFPVVRSVSPAPASTQLSQHYDQAGRLRYSRNESVPGMLTTNYNYDPNGNLTSVSDPEGNAVNYTYETSGWLTKAARYASVRNAETDGVGQQSVTTLYTYDRQGRRLSVSVGAGLPTTYEYDGLGQPTVEKDGLGQARNRTYDGLGRVASSSDAAGRQESFLYDDASRLVKRTSSLVTQSLVTGFTYNALGQPTLMRDINNQYQNGTPVDTAFRYDGLGRLISVTNSSGVITYSYNRLNQRDLLHHTTLLPNGQPDLVSARVVSYTYDGLGRLTKMVADGDNCKSYQYHYSGLLLSSLDYPCYTNSFAGPTAEFGYDQADRLVTLSQRQGTSRPFYAVSYQLDKLGNRTWSSESIQPAAPFEGSRNVEYSYDELGRLNRAEEKRGSGGGGSPNQTVYAYNYQYDGAGNRKANSRWLRAVDTSFFLMELSSYQYDNASRLTQQFSRLYDPTTPLSRTTAYSYDGANNLLGEAIQTVTQTGVLTAAVLVTTTSSVGYDYDARNRLSQWQSQPNAQTWMTNIYSYDGLDTRIRLDSGGSHGDFNYSISYLQDIGSGLPVVLREKYLPDGSQRGYLYAPGSTSPLQEEIYGSGQVSYNHSDGLGSVRVRLNSSGEQIAQNLYPEPFGGAGSLAAGNPSRATNTANTAASNFKLGGEQQDGASGLYYNRARYYNPSTGRFTQQDTYGGDVFDQASLNRFAYAHNNPTNLTDPSGNCPSCIGAAIGFAFGALANYQAQANQTWQLGGSFYPFGPNNRIDWGEVALAGGKGAVVGGIGGAFGAGSGLAGAVGSSVAAGRSMQVADNLLNGKDWATNLLDAPSIALDAATGGTAHYFLGGSVGRKASAASDTSVGASKAASYCSFSAETVVATDNGNNIPISQLKVGDKVLAYDEATGTTGYYTVTAVLLNFDKTIEYLTIDNEQLETTPEHPFFTREKGWVTAGDLWQGAQVRKANGSYGVVNAVQIVQHNKLMYNLTVETVHTFFVGSNRWLVHNHCGERHSTILAENMKKFGVKRPLFGGWQAHHVIPDEHWNHPFVARARRVGWDNDDVYNGIYLPSRNYLGARWDLPVHRGSHGKYNDFVGEHLDILEQTHRTYDYDDEIAFRQLAILTDTLKEQLGYYSGPNKASRLK